MKKLFVALLFISGLSGNLLAQKKNHQKHTTTKKKISDRKNIVKYGVASCYAQKFNGRRTANDEIFSSLKYTAACNVLPFNTWIKVTNLRNHKSIIVRVNDRLHPKNKRLVDLPKIGAQKLGYFGRGVTKVKVEVLKNYHP
jgi:rare lipoprotein A